jgi:hypothetical protein
MKRDEHKDREPTNTTLYIFKVDLDAASFFKLEHDGH